MLDNPLSQIERTKDAYAGDMQGLQKRANMTKELVDLLAMQQLKQDLDAVKRNQMMQQQGNPETIKDQMQQGLMGEYRQQAAKEMGVGPSEMDVVQRARQGMPQGMPQGAPQQPQMAQGVMSQARPVQLAGGGIVAFQQGGGAQGPNLPPDQLAEFLRKQVDTLNMPANYKALEFKRLMNEAGFDPLGRPLTGGITTPIAKTSAGQMRRGQRSGIASLTDDDDDDTKEATEEVVEEVAEETIEEVTQDSNEDSSKTKTPAPLTGLDAITQKQIELFTQDVPKFEPPQASQRLRDAIGEGIMSLDEARAESTKREDRALELMGMGPDGQSRRDFEEQLTGLAALRDRNAETQRRRDLVEFLGAGFSRGAETYVAQEDARRARDESYLTERAAIQNKRAELQKVAGQEAVDSYDNALSSYLTTRNNSINALGNLEAQDREDYRTSYKAGMDSKQMQADILSSLSDQAQSALSRAISGQAAEAQSLNAANAVMKEMQAQQIARINNRIAELVPNIIAKSQIPGYELSDTEKAARDKAIAKAKLEFATEQGAIDELNAKLLERASGTMTEEEISPNSAGGAAITAYSS
jgi:hypothetical protein